MTAFRSGVLISAIAYDLVEEAVNVSATGISVAVGSVLGSLVFPSAFVAGDKLPGMATAAGFAFAALLFFSA